MAIGGSFNKAAFNQQDPIQMMWARRMWDWDTQNPFAKGVQQPMTVHGGGVSSGRQGVRMLNTQVPVGQIDQAVARPVNVLGSARNISAGGRNYGDQSIDRNEIERLKNTGSAFIQMARGMGEQQQAGTAGPAPTTSQAPAPTPPTPGQQRRQTRRLAKQGVPAPPQPAQQQPGTLPAPVLPTPSALATTDWKTEQEQRKRDYEASRTAPQPAVDAGASSRAYLEEVARRRANRPTGPSQAGMAPPAPFSRRPSPLPPPPPGSRTFDRSTFPAPTVTPVLPTPTSLVGDQSARLAAEGTAPSATGAPMETTGVKSTTKPLTRSLTKPLTKKPSGSGGAGGAQATTGTGTTARQPRRKR